MGVRLILAFIVLPLISSAQFSFLGADAHGMANTHVAIPAYSSVYHNPAGIAAFNQSFLSVNYFKTLPIEGLNTIGAQGVFSNSLLDVGFTADNFGDQYYRESRAGLILAKQLDKVSIGVKGSYYGVNIEDMSSRNGFIGEAGMLVNPSRFFSLGLHVLNITGTQLYTDVYLPTVVAFGAAIHPDEKLTISSQADFVTGQKLVYRFGLSYQIREALGLSSGVDPELRSLHFGLNMFVKQYGLNYAVSSHPNVGLAHHLSFVFRFNE